jgi:hypothetical protein
VRTATADRGHWRVSEHEANVIYRRLLRLTDRYIARQKGSLLVTDGRGLMTWGEIRRHIKEALSMTVIK